MIQEEAKDLVWRIDDDVIAEPDCLEKLLFYFETGDETQVIGAVGGPILMPGADTKDVNSMDLNLSDNQQWHKFNEPKEASHLYSSFLCKAKIVDYELALSSAAHREETILTHNIHRKGYKLILEPEAICWHLRNPEGGIRENKPEDWRHDQKIFEEIQKEWKGELIAYLDSGLGDHIIFKKILPSLRLKYKSIKIACCYPELFPTEETISIAEGMKLITPERFNIYKWCIDHNWKTELKEAMRRMYDSNCPL
jgi:GT2 family glycosyltransferase